jgi:hypothetical protein
MTTSLLPGDLLISRRPGTGLYEISTIPGPAQLLAVSYSAAVATASEVATRELVDVWHSEDSIHFQCVARYRVLGSWTSAHGWKALAARR